MDGVAIPNKSATKAERRLFHENDEFDGMSVGIVSLLAGATDFCFGDFVSCSEFSCGFFDGPFRFGEVFVAVMNK